MTQFKRAGKALTQMQAYVYDKLDKGDVIVCTHLEDGEVEYRLLSGHRLNILSFKKLRDAGLIKAQADGLLDDAAQTWVRA